MKTTILVGFLLVLLTAVQASPIESDQDLYFDTDDNNGNADSPLFDENDESSEDKTSSDDYTIVDGDLLIRKEDLPTYEKHGHEKFVQNQAWGLIRHWKWSKNVKYRIHSYLRSNATMMKFIMDSIRELHYRTCLKFSPATKYDKQYIYFLKGKYCVTYYGRPVKGIRYIYLGDKCTKSRIPAHEIMHALGRFHEQARPDRDHYISLDFSNIWCPEQYYRKRANTLRIPYDYYSVMHYPPTACSKNKKPVMAFKKFVNTERVGKYDYMTYRDIEHIRRSYCI